MFKNPPPPQRWKMLIDLCCRDLRKQNEGLSPGETPPGRLRSWGSMEEGKGRGEGRGGGVWLSETRFVEVMEHTCKKTEDTKLTGLDEIAVNNKDVEYKVWCAV